MVFEKIAKMLSEQIDCEIEEIKPETKFSDLGIDSLDITELLMNIEDEFEIELEMDASMEKVSDVVDKINEKLK